MPRKNKREKVRDDQPVEVPRKKRRDIKGEPWRPAKRYEEEN